MAINPDVNVTRREIDFRPHLLGGVIKNKFWLVQEYEPGAIDPTHTTPR